MWSITLVMLIFQGDALVNVWEPNARYETMAVCESAARKFLAMPINGGENRRASALCIDPRTDEIVVLQTNSQRG